MEPAGVPEESTQICTNKLQSKNRVQASCDLRDAESGEFLIGEHNIQISL